MRRRRLAALILAAAVLTPAAPAAGVELVVDPLDPGTIGSVGCSNTLQGVQGYLAASSFDLLAETAKASKDIAKWARDPLSTDRRNAWSKYLEQRPVGGYDSAFIWLCGRWNNRKDRPRFSVDTVATIVTKIHSLDPGVPVYVVPHPQYPPGNACRATDGNKASLAGEAMIPEILDTVPLTWALPFFDPLLPSHVADDHCHMTEEGRLVIGRQLVEFFDQ